MRRHNEQEKTYHAILQGGIRVEPRKQVGILVARIPIPRLSLLQDPFWAYTLDCLDRCEEDGVKLRGGVVIPWNTLTARGGVVRVRPWRIQHEIIPIINLQSLQRL